MRRGSRLPQMGAGGQSETSQTSLCSSQCLTGNLNCGFAGVEVLTTETGATKTIKCV